MEIAPSLEVPRKLDRLSALISHLRISAELVDEAGATENANFFIFRGETGGIRLVFCPCLLPRGTGVDRAVLRRGLGDPQGPKQARQSDVGALPGERALVVARIELAGVGPHVVLALPGCVSICLEDAPDLACVVKPLSEEVTMPRCGGMAVFLRLCEVVVIRLLRHTIERGNANAGLLAGLAHPRLAHALVAMHDSPGRSWSLEDLAEVAGMSRTQFAVTFREVLGITPGGYLSDWRLSLARIALLRGDPVKTVARASGFSSSASFSRAYSRRFGETPSRLRAAAAA